MLWAISTENSENIKQTWRLGCVFYLKKVVDSHALSKKGGFLPTNIHRLFRFQLLAVFSETELPFQIDQS